MNIKRIRDLSGPNIFSYNPVLLMQIEFDETDEALSKNHDFHKYLAELTADSERASENMREIRTAKNDLAEAIKNTVLKLSGLAGFNNVGAAVRCSDDPNIFEIAVEYSNKEATEFLLETSVKAVAAMLKNQAFDVNDKAREAKQITDKIFSGNLENTKSRVPIVAITGTNGKTTVTRLIAHVLHESGLNVGTATTDGILFNGETIKHGDTTGPASARTVLNTDSVDIAVLETARGGIMRRGLGWDWADVAVITNITEDHIGQDGIESVADLVDIKSLIAERVRENGTLIFNADDPESSALAHRPAVERIKRKIVFFALDERNWIVADHLEKGETAYFVKEGWICEAKNSEILPIADTKSIPIAMNGTADFQIQNALAVTAAVRSFDLTPEQIADGLYSFQNTLHNPGRNNFYRVGEGFALVDYGHNPKAMEAICRMTSRWEGKTVTGIISFPGDRRDDVIETAGRVAVAGFDRIIVKGDVNLRGREQGEVARMLCRLVLEAGNQSECEIVLDAAEAFEKAIAAIKKDEVVVFFYEKMPPVQATLRKYGAVPTTTF